MSASEITLANDNAPTVASVVEVADFDPTLEAQNDEFLFLDEELKEHDGSATSLPEVDTAAVSVDMSNLLDDEEKAVNGTWLTYKGRTRVRIARQGNSKAQAMLSRLYSANRALIDAGGAQADALSKRIYNEVEAKCIVTGFEFMEFAGMAVDYTPRSALYFLTKSADFKTWVTRQSQNMENFTRKATEADIEQAKKLLSGN